MTFFFNTSPKTPQKRVHGGTGKPDDFERNLGAQKEHFEKINFPPTAIGEDYLEFTRFQIKKFFEKRRFPGNFENGYETISVFWAEQKTHINATKKKSGRNSYPSFPKKLKF